MTSTTTSKKWLFEISFIRPILLLLLVGYHAFAPYSGAWNGCIVEHNEVYRWLAYAFRAFRLEAFVFVSGYVFALQVIEKQKFNNIQALAKSKFKRLIIPCWLFSVIYILCFGKPTWKIVQGVGHLWYLPCLFWCFLIGYLVYKKSDIRPSQCIIALIVLASISFVPIPLQINRAMYYFLFFYIGGLFWKNTKLIHNWVSNKNCIYLWGIFIVLFLGCNILTNYTLTLFDNYDITGKVIIKMINNISKILLAFSGISSMYASAVIFLRNHTLSQKVINIGDYGYGVYIFHQFILIALYYHTNLPVIMGSTLLPWIGLIISLSGSLLLSWLFRQTKLGMALI